MIKKLRKTSPVEDDTSCFPCDIIENILSRLPLKSLIRFKAVCKSWKATVEDPGFAKIHSNQSFCLIGESRDGTYKSIKFQGDEPCVHSTAEFPETMFGYYAEFLCCCEGILLFKHYCDEPNYVLWNPFTGKHSTFSCPYEDLIPRKPLHSYGLCFDKYEDDYKVIVVLREGHEYLVYSIKNDSWSKSRNKFRGLGDAGGTYIDGIVYWMFDICFKDQSWREGIICFDPKDNSLNELHKPADLQEERILHTFLTNFSGNLCMYAHVGEKFKIWLLKESGGCKSWTKLTTLVNRKSAGGSWVHCPICLTSKNELLFHDGEHYCLDKQKFGEPKELPDLWGIVESACLESLSFPAIPTDRHSSDK